MKDKQTDSATTMASLKHVIDKTPPLLSIPRLDEDLRRNDQIYDLVNEVMKNDE